MQLGFVLDMTRCIGCHACTVACKSENDVPLGDFRTWVKYTEQGSFPDVKRSFTVLRCNQCTEAPCVAICPVTALAKRPDGIVDVDHRICIGCKACMQGCPYDALYLNEGTGTAQKCHFCAHRVEQGLAPACAVVCPTEAIVPGDFDDSQSRVARMKHDFDLSVRKPEAGTGPNVYYREANAAGLQPLTTNASGGYLWAQQQAGPRLDAQLFEAMEARAREGGGASGGHAGGGGHANAGSSGRAGAGVGLAGTAPSARTVYDVDRQPHWGGFITGYLFFKSLAAGTFLAGMLLLSPSGLGGAGAGAGLRAPIGVPLLSLLFLGLTLLLLVADLKRPERFLKIMLRPNWNSWLAKGSFVLMGYGLLLTGWFAMGLNNRAPAGFMGWNLALITALFAAGSSAYTALLFAQAKGRVLWMKRGYAWHLLAQALVAGSAVLLLCSRWMELDRAAQLALGDVLIGALLLHLAFTLAEGKLAPRGREAEYARVLRLLTHGPYARLHWTGGIALGVVLPVVLLCFASGGALAVVAAVFALGGLWVEKDAFVRAGQALPIS